MLLFPRICVGLGLTSRRRSSMLENEMNIDGIPHRRPVGAHHWPEAQRQQDFREPAIVSSVARLVERDEGSIALLVDIEPRDEVVRLVPGRCWKRGEEKS